MDKKTPMRTCIACKKVKPKRELIRVVNGEDGISLDFTGKKNGRGAYVCNDLACIETLKKKKALNRAFKTPVGDEIYDKIAEEFFGNEK